jgi:hypothetical protein
MSRYAPRFRVQEREEVSSNSGPLSPAGERDGVRVLGSFKCDRPMPGDLMKTRLCVWKVTWVSTLTLTLSQRERGPELPDISSLP